MVLCIPISNFLC